MTESLGSMLEHHLEIQTTIRSALSCLVNWVSNIDRRLKRHIFEVYLVRTIEENNPCDWWDSAGEWLDHSMANPISRFPSPYYILLSKSQSQWPKSLFFNEKKKDKSQSLFYSFRLFMTEKALKRGLVLLNRQINSRGERVMVVSFDFWQNRLSCAFCRTVELKLVSAW